MLRYEITSFKFPIDCIRSDVMSPTRADNLIHEDDVRCQIGELSTNVANTYQADSNPPPPLPPPAARLTACMANTPAARPPADAAKTSKLKRESWTWSAASQRHWDSAHRTASRPTARFPAPPSLPRLDSLLTRLRKDAPR